MLLKEVTVVFVNLYETQFSLKSTQEMFSLLAAMDPDPQLQGGCVGINNDLCLNQTDIHSARRIQ